MIYYLNSFTNVAFFKKQRSDKHQVHSNGCLWREGKGLDKREYEDSLRGIGNILMLVLGYGFSGLCSFYYAPQFNMSVPYFPLTILHII